MEEKVKKCVYVQDHRFRKKKVKEVCLEVTDWDFNDFLGKVHLDFSIEGPETFVLTTTDRAVLDHDKFDVLPNGSTLYLLQKEDQALQVATKELITFTPHYDTLVRSGTYEYYMSEGRVALPYAIAEFIDNALTATAKNTGAREIEIQLMFDETYGKPALIVLDNGCGMTSKKLNNWAVYRQSKFLKNYSTFADEEEGYVPPSPVPRSLNSDISYFGVGGKQAVFYIGNSVRVITKPANSPDVHELVVSKEEFERKERKKENVFTGVIRNRKPGDCTHVKKTDDRFLNRIIGEEGKKKSFTAMIVTGIYPEHVTFLKEDFQVWTRQLAHVYHYYIHGVNGNDTESNATTAEDPSKVDIRITLRQKAPGCHRQLNLREIDDDMQSLYIKSCADSFEFNVTTEDGGTVEGLIRYHPFLYDRETYPKEVTQASCDEDEDDDDDAESESQHPSRGKRPIFECFWNGRLIPYTTVMDFDWCAWSKDSKVPVECYSRLSGVIFTDYKFEVSTNKLTFMDLELKLKRKSSLFTRCVKGQKQRGIQKEFAQWLKNCHVKLDKEIKFLGYKETITRTDVLTKDMQHPWSTFSSIEWDGNVYKTGQLVKSHSTHPILYGTIHRFLLYGNYNNDVFATAGQVEVTLQPAAFYNTNRIIPVSKIDQMATVEAIKRHVQSDMVRLPKRLEVEWPEGNPVPQNGVLPADLPLGPIQVKILNGKGEFVSTMPMAGKGTGKKLVVDLRLYKRGDREDEEVLSCCAQHIKTGYWFKRIDNHSHLGKYTLTLTTMIYEGNVTNFGGRELPSYKLNFTSKAGSAASFAPNAASSTPVGAHFNITLRMSDVCNNQAVPPPGLKPVLACSDVDLTYEKVDISGMTAVIRNVKASGKLLNSEHSKLCKLSITLPGLKNETQILTIVLVPGKPHSLHVTTVQGDSIENKTPVVFNIEVHDEAGNITANAKQTVTCQIQGFPLLSIDCSITGAAQLVTKPLDVGIINGKPQNIQVDFKMPNQKNVPMVTMGLLVVPSTKVFSMELYSKDDRNLVLKNGETIDWPAGGLLENLHYRLYDEGLFEMPLTPDIASEIKVNWKKKVNLEDLLNGKLPDLEVPTQVLTQANEERVYRVVYQDKEVSFSIVPQPNEPSKVKVTLPQTWVRQGEKLPGHIKLEVTDRYDNVIKARDSTSVGCIKIDAEGLDKSAIAFNWQESSSSVQVTGIQFNTGTPGTREMSFTYMNYKTCAVIKVMPGVPAQLKLISEPEKPLQVFKERGIATPFVVQLCDKWGNPVSGDRVMVDLMFSPLKLTNSVTSQSVDAEGKASFTVKSVSGPEGSHQLKFKATCNGARIPGPSVNLIILPDPNKPIRLSVEYDTQKQFPAGGKFPVFSVSVISEEGSMITTFNPADVSMFLWQGAAAGTAPQSATELKCSKPMENERKGCFYFRDKDIPDYAGKYTIMFCLRGDKDLTSDQITINVVANDPVKLAPDSQPPAPVVCYRKDISSCTLLENLTLRILDSFGNPAGQNLHGVVTVSMRNSSEEDNRMLPLFEGKAKSVQFRLEGGEVLITRLAVMNSAGKDGHSYTLIFTPEVSTVSTPLAPFQLPFHFYNDAEKQQRMSALTKKKNKLTTAISVLEDNLTTCRQLLQLLTDQHNSACSKECDQRKALNMKHVPVEPSATVPFIQNLIQARTNEFNQILKTSRRRHPINDPYKGQQDVLGMVSNLALVQDDDATRVISWALSANMDCIVTKTTSAAQRIYDATKGKQQVLPLDTVFVCPNRPLPHIRNGRTLFDPPGNPIFARDLLIYPEDEQRCDIVFRNLLGNVIVIDNLDSGNWYRREVVKNGTNCPTILTRKGEKIASNAIFGGERNRAPPMDRLIVFEAPHPERCSVLKKEIEMLTQYMATLEKVSKVRDELGQAKESPEMEEKEKELKKKKKELEEIDKMELTMRTQKRHPDAGEPSDVAAKRAKQM